MLLDGLSLEPLTSLGSGDCIVSLLGSSLSSFLVGDSNVSDSEKSSTTSPRLDGDETTDSTNEPSVLKVLTLSDENLAADDVLGLAKVIELDLLTRQDGLVDVGVLELSAHSLP